MAKKYSSKERKAFHMGRAWAAGKAGKQVSCPDEKTKQSFRNGVKAARNKKTGASKNAKANCANCGASLYVVDGNGVVVGVVDGGKI